MKLVNSRCFFIAIAAVMLWPRYAPAQTAGAQTPLTWPEVKARFESANPSLKAARANVDESRAEEVTAFLRPNPNLTGTIDQINPFSTQPPPSGSGPNVYSPFAFALPSASLSYLHERDHKRELRLKAARQATEVADSTYTDQERGLTFNLRNAFVQTLQAKAVLQNARENLDYWDRELAVNRNRFKEGDLAEVDLDRRNCSAYSSSPIWKPRS